MGLVWKGGRRHQRSLVTNVNGQVKLSTLGPTISSQSTKTYSSRGSPSDPTTTVPRDKTEPPGVSPVSAAVASVSPHISTESSTISTAGPNTTSGQSTINTSPHPVSNVVPPRTSRDHASRAPSSPFTSALKSSVTQSVSATKTVTDSPSSGPNSGAIAAGVVVPVIVILVILAIVYIWYRKRYPVRMILGKDFGIFTNPAYNKKTSTVTLERQNSFEKEYKQMTMPRSEAPRGLDNPSLDLTEEHANYQPMYNPAFSAGLVSSMLSSDNEDDRDPDQHTYENLRRSPVAPPRAKKTRAKVVVQEPDENRISRASSGSSSFGSNHDDDTEPGFKPLTKAPEVKRKSDDDVAQDDDEDFQPLKVSPEIKKLNPDAQANDSGDVRGGKLQRLNSEESLSSVSQDSHGIVFKIDNKLTENGDKETINTNGVLKNNSDDRPVSISSGNSSLPDEIRAGSEFLDKEKEDIIDNGVTAHEQEANIVFRFTEDTAHFPADAALNESSTDDTPEIAAVKSETLETNGCERGVAFENVVKAVTFDPESVSLLPHSDPDAGTADQGVILAEQQELKSDESETKTRKISAYYGPLFSEKSQNISDDDDDDECLAGNEITERRGSDSGERIVAFNPVVDEVVYDVTSVRRPSQDNRKNDAVDHHVKALRASDDTKTRKISAYYGDVMKGSASGSDEEEKEEEEGVEEDSKGQTNGPYDSGARGVSFQSTVDEVTFSSPPSEGEDGEGLGAMLEEQTVSLRKLKTDESESKARKISEFYGGLLEEKVERYYDDDGQPAVRLKEEEETSQHGGAVSNDVVMTNNVDSISYATPTGDHVVTTAARTSSLEDVTLDEQSFAIDGSTQSQPSDLGPDLGAAGDHLIGVPGSQSFEEAGPVRKTSTSSRRSSMGNVSDENASEHAHGPRRRVGVALSPPDLTDIAPSGAGSSMTSSDLNDVTPILTPPSGAMGAAKPKKVISFSPDTKDDNSDRSSDSDISSLNSNSDDSEMHEYKVGSPTPGDPVASPESLNLASIMDKEWSHLWQGPRDMAQKPKQGSSASSSIDSDIVRAVEDTSSSDDDPGSPENSPLSRSPK